MRYRGRENRQLHAAHLRRGPVVRVAPGELSVNDVAGLRSVYGGGMEKGHWYTIFDNYGVPCMFSASNSRPHSARKRMISNAYSKSYIHNSPVMARQAQVILYDRLLPVISSLAGSTTAGYDVHELWNSTALDFITAYLFGTKNASNFLRDDEYRKHWLSLYYTRKRYTFFSQELPRLTRFFKSCYIHLIPTWVDDANKELEAWCKDRCDATETAIKESEKDSDIGNEPVVLNALLTGIEKEKSSKGSESVLAQETLRYPELSIASEMIDHLAAGHETSGITLTYLSWHLSRDVSLQKALRTELRTLSTSMLLGNDSAIPSSKDLDALPLLHAVLMETLRLCAAIPGNQPRVTPYPSCSIGAYQIPGGVRIGAQAYSVHRNPEVYPDPEKWDHKRWLDSENGLSEDQKRERDRSFWAFSSGGRMCIGSNFAMHEIKLVIAAVYSNFTTHIVDDEGIEQLDGYTCGPVSNKLILRFEKVVD
ncbi:cytochrome P450 3A12 [Phlyctema vagabunda]|uniref:Cytochrome P450 3A12 n=1 Tax=Phlyctema vagabunda TaxID=108571 RepID=A0ABR4PKF1_9HELO